MGTFCNRPSTVYHQTFTSSFDFDNNYFNDRYQGIPIGGYNVIIENMLKDVEVELGVDFFANRQELEASAEKSCLYRDDWPVLWL
mgnify:CR=1 FL=1